MDRQNSTETVAQQVLRGNLESVQEGQVGQCVSLQKMIVSLTVSV